MKSETMIRVQAYVDGELPSAERSDVEELLSSDSEAKLLYDELRRTREWMQCGEVDQVVSDSREFYWSQIEHQLNEPGGGPSAQPRPSQRTPIGRSLGRPSAR